VKRQFVDILGGLAAAADRDSPALTSSNFSRRHSTCQDALSASCSSWPEPRRLAGGKHLLQADRSAAAEERPAMRRSCAAAVLACSARAEPPSDSTKIVPPAHSDRHNDPRARPKPMRRPTLSARRRLSENKENVAERCDDKLPVSVGVCRAPEIRFPRLFPDLTGNEDDEEQQSSVVGASSTTMTLEDVSAISRTSDGEGGGVLHHVRSTTSVSSLNGAFCSSDAGDVGDDSRAAAAGAFCSTFSYPLHSTVVDSFFDVSALLPPPPTQSAPSGGTVHDHGVDERSVSSQRRHADGSSRDFGHRRSDAQERRESLHPRLFSDDDRPDSLLDDVSSRCRPADTADGDRQRPSTSVELLSASSATEPDFARTGDANCTSRLRRQMGQTRLHTTTTSSSSSRRQSDLARSSCSRFVNADEEYSRSTLFECGCCAERRFRRLPTTAEYNVLPTSNNHSLGGSHRRAYVEQFDAPACFTDTCRSWAPSSDRRRMTMHCPPATTSDTRFTTADAVLRRDQYRIPADDRQRTECRRQVRCLAPHRTSEERSDRRQWATVVPRDRVSGSGCPLCGCGRTSAGDASTAAAAAARNRPKTSKLASSNCDDAAAERRRKRALLRKLRRFSDAFYGNSGELQLKTFGHF